MRRREIPRAWTPTRRDTLRVLAGAGVAVLAPRMAYAQAEWPTRPIKLVVPSSPGGAADFTARTFAKRLEADCGQPVVIDNKPGAGAIIGAVTVKNAAPDGYTFLMAGNSTHGANPSLFTKLPYDPVGDFEQVGMFGQFPMVGLARRGSNIDSVEALIRLAKEQPGKLTFGYYTASSQVPVELIKSRTGIEMLPVPYKSVGDLTNALVGGSIDMAFVDALSAWATIQGGLLPVIAVTSPQAFAALRNVPPVARTLPGFEVQGWLGLAAPKGTPRAIVDKMSGYLRTALADPAVKDALQGKGMSVRAMTPAEQAQFVDADIKRWAEWVKVAKIPPANL